MRIPSLVDSQFVRSAFVHLPTASMRRFCCRGGSRTDHGREWSGLLDLLVAEDGKKAFVAIRRFEGSLAEASAQEEAAAERGARRRCDDREVGVATG